MVSSIRPDGVIGDFSGEFHPQSPLSAATAVATARLRTDGPMGEPLQKAIRYGADSLSDHEKKRLFLRAGTAKVLGDLLTTNALQNLAGRNVPRLD